MAGIVLPKFETDGPTFKGSYIIYITWLYIKQMVHGRGIKELKMRVMRPVRYTYTAVPIEGRSADFKDCVQ